MIDNQMVEKAFSMDQVIKFIKGKLIRVVRPAS
jgi:hypothetical protein